MYPSKKLNTDEDDKVSDQCYWISETFTLRIAILKHESTANLYNVPLGILIKSKTIKSRLLRTMYDRD